VAQQKGSNGAVCRLEVTARNKERTHGVLPGVRLPRDVWAELLRALREPDAVNRNDVALFDIIPTTPIVGDPRVLRDVAIPSRARLSR
jgi:hypothetical protein